MEQKPGISNVTPIVTPQKLSSRCSYSYLPRPVVLDDDDARPQNEKTSLKTVIAINNGKPRIITKSPKDIQKVRSSSANSLSELSDEKIRNDFLNIGGGIKLKGFSSSARSFRNSRYSKRGEDVLNSSQSDFLRKSSDKSNSETKAVNNSYSETKAVNKSNSVSKALDQLEVNIELPERFTPSPVSSCKSESLVKSTRAKSILSNSPSSKNRQKTNEGVKTFKSSQPFEDKGCSDSDASGSNREHSASGKGERRKSKLLRELASSNGYIAEKKAAPTSDNLFVDSSLLSREERSLQV